MEINKSHVCTNECEKLRPVGSKYMYVWWIDRAANDPNPAYATLDRLIVLDHAACRNFPRSLIYYAESITSDPNYKSKTVHRNFWPIVKGRIVWDWKLAVNLGLQPHPFPRYANL